jgi:transcriptional regulator GlxA family with amidase domain
MTLDQWLAAVAETSFTRESNPWSDLVEQAKRLALAHLDEPLHISALCRTLEVSERTLRKAFQKLYGVPPCRHLRMLRLSQARRALLAADYKLVTVTEIATGCGFLELGRFSVEYRKAFGESPSHTLHHASQAKTFLDANWVSA